MLPPKKKRTIHAGSVRSDQELAEIGIHKYESKRIRIYTDIPKKQAADLPKLIDQIFPAWSNYYSKVPTQKTEAVFPLTGYIIRDRDLFVQTGLLPERIQLFAHGDIEDGRFWMHQQETDYFRRHLMLHEATHCFMTSVPNGQPVWYLEGMAELFALHRIDSKGNAQFGVMPVPGDKMKGFKRIESIHTEIDQGRFLPIRRIVPFRSEHFSKFKQPYAWSWALCLFLDRHPGYQKRFRKIGQLWTGNTFATEFSKWLEEEGTRMEAEWLNFAYHLEPGFDLNRAAVLFETGKPLKESKPVTKTIEAARGWQSTGIHVDANQYYHLKATGRYTLAQKPKPWVSEPQGVSIRYHNGQPLGKLVAAVLADSPPKEKETLGTFAKTIPISREQTFTPTASGTLYLRINDSFADLSDNTGQVTVTIQSSLPGLK